MLQFFSIDNILFTLLGYNVCLIELIGFVTGLLAVYLAGRTHVSTFIIGLLNCVCYFAIFWQQQLYSMMLLQIVFFTLDIYGIYAWIRPQKDKKLQITRLQPQNIWWVMILIVFGGIIWGAGVESMANHFPDLVQLPDYPFVDAIITFANVEAQFLLARKKIENWFVWIAADSASVILCCALGMYLTAILYACYITISVTALRRWYREV